MYLFLSKCTVYVIIPKLIIKTICDNISQQEKFQEYKMDKIGDTFVLFVLFV